MKLKLSRQYLEDLSSNFMPYMILAVEGRIRANKGTELELLERICLSELQAIDLIFKRKLLTLQHKFSITLKEAEGIVFLKIIMQIPIPANHFWRLNLRNEIVNQLDKQLV